MLTINDWKSIIQSGLEQCSVIKKRDIKRNLQEKNENWISFDIIPEDEDFEAWTDSEGVLDIEIPDEFCNELVVWCESNKYRCCIEKSRSNTILHINLYLEPPIIEESLPITEESPE